MTLNSLSLYARESIEHVWHEVWKKDVDFLNTPFLVVINLNFLQRSEIDCDLLWDLKSP